MTTSSPLMALSVTLCLLWAGFVYAAEFTISGTVSQSLTGTVTVGPGSNLVIGSGTVFTRELQAGATLRPR